MPAAPRDAAAFLTYHKAFLGKRPLSGHPCIPTDQEPNP